MLRAWLLVALITGIWLRDTGDWGGALVMGTLGLASGFVGWLAGKEVRRE
ncbi:MAG: hypothetical protein ACP5JV_06780 [Thermus sp.]